MRISTLVEPLAVHAAPPGPTPPDPGRKCADPQARAVRQEHRRRVRDTYTSQNHATGRQRRRGRPGRRRLPALVDGTPSSSRAVPTSVIRYTPGPAGPHSAPSGHFPVLRRTT